mmetsp:Transcript_6763/g.12178  ORF Transcript_6763/g.12178 Transcript_6763/m.12178 type:complete len:94 (+) Transcript_6763:245-526(+)
MSALYYRSLAALRTKGMYIRNVSSSSMTKNSQATIKLPFEKQVYEFRGLADALNNHRKNEQIKTLASAMKIALGGITIYWSYTKLTHPLDDEP